MVAASGVRVTGGLGVNMVEASALNVVVASVVDMSFSGVPEVPQLDH